MGCHRQASLLHGGTAGTIRLGGMARADLQINVFEDGEQSRRRVAYGVSDAQGDFSLIADDGLESAILPPGKYRLTIESVAAVPIPIPATCRDIQTTKLVQEWSASDKILAININESDANR